MTIISIPAIHLLKLPGFVAVWGMTELLLLHLLLHLNARLFAGEVTLDRTPVYYLLAAMAIGTIGAIWPLYHMQTFSYAEQAILSVTGALIATLISYWLFGIEDVREFLWRKLVNRIPLLAGD
jgi:hypothetical protein